MLFESETRRRTWYSVIILDMQAAFDGELHSALAGSGLINNSPSHSDDIDISVKDGNVAVYKPCFTDMTFVAVTHEPTRYLRNLAHVPTGSEGHPLMMQDLSERYAIVEECARVLHEKFLRHCNTAVLLKRLTRPVGEDMIITSQFLVRRPMHRF